MFIARDLLPGWLLVALWPCLLLTVSVAARYADWRAILHVPYRLHLLLGGSAACLVLWLISVRAIDGLWLHFLGVTSLTLLLGWRFATLAGSLAVIAQTLLIGQPLSAAAPAWLLSVLIPASVSRYIVHRLRRVRSRNLFLYMLGAGFGGGAACALLVALAAMALLATIGRHDLVERGLEQWPMLALIMFPEGFINGMVVSTLTVFYPQLVKTFDEKHYLGEE